jgi:mono/diheme cytochrome c family protein
MRFRVGALAAVALIACATPLIVHGQTGARKGPLTSLANRLWPAPVSQDEPEVPPPLSPADALKTFTMAPGYHLELVASEPLTKDPILMEFDGDGRLWVLEMHGFSINEQMENSFEPINDLAVLEDTDGDGVYDKRTVFMDKLIMPRAFKILDKNCALVGEPPNLWKACDTNGDLKADTKDLLEKTFSTQGVVEHGANGLYWAMDNTLVVSEHTWNARLKNGKFETLPSLNRGQWGVTQDNGGRIYRNVNTDPLFVDYVLPKYFVRNPNMVRTNGLYESLVKQEDTLIWPAHPTRGLNRGYREASFRPDGSATYYGGVSSPLIYRGDRLPKDVQNQPFVVDGPTNIVHLLNLKDDGTGRLSATDFYKKGEFLASTDIRFRPVQVVTGWDGTIYVVDMYRGISQDGPIQTDYLRSYNAKRELAKGINYGRIYRVVHDGMTADKKPQMSKETPAQLVAHLSHPNGWWRDTAQQLIVQRGDKSVVPALKKLAANAPADYTRIQALWTLDGLDSADPQTVTRALDDQSPDIRAAAVRISEHWLDQSKPIQTAVLKKIDDPNWLVRRQVAASLGELPAEARVAPLVSVLRKYGDDPITVDAAISGLPGQEAEVLAQLLTQPQPSADAITMLAGATGKRRDVAATQGLIILAADAKQPAAVRLALLNGLALGLQGGGSSTVGSVVAGGRAGGGIPGVSGRRGAAASRFELTSEPTALATLAKGAGDLADAAKQVVSLVGWPGKPAAPVGGVRTAAEEALFKTGQGIYEANCSGCHTPEGRGAGTLAADLAGSRLVTGNADVPVRILMAGKEGKLGVMPPLGAAMSDDEVAAVLTYVRGSFGNTAPPVPVAGVKEWRAAYAHRETPWTDEELAPRR